MRIADFDYELPMDLIAQHPLAQRDAARMLVLDRAAQTFSDNQFAEISSYLRAGDTLVVNNTRVFPARLMGTRAKTGGRVELFLVGELEKQVWAVLTRPARKLKTGTHINFSGQRLRAEILERLPDGQRIVRFECDEDFDALLEEIGQTPLPPYIKRDEKDVSLDDRERYQTVYARARGAIAAPTAGLHFTPRVMDEIKARDVNIVEITLHVGYGTFAPVHVDDLSEHKVAPERFEITDEAAHLINETRAGRKGRIIAVGTTTVRALEAAVDISSDAIKSGARTTDLTITPNYHFRVVDALLTNFHLPRSSLLVLVSAFAGHDLTLAAYQHAVQARYRFYSYGDCMLIV